MNKAALKALGILIGLPGVMMILMGIGKDDAALILWGAGLMVISCISVISGKNVGA